MQIYGPVTHTIGRVAAANSSRTTSTFRQQERNENFPVAFAMLPRRVRKDLHAVYAVARTIDDIGDLAPGDRTRALHDFRDELHELWRGSSGLQPVIQNLAQTVRTRNLSVEPFDRLIEANLLDQQVTRYDTFDDLIGYCRLSADPVGRLVLAIFEQSSPTTQTLSDHICRALQILEHLQDVSEDRVAGRIYLPQKDLGAFGVRESDLDLQRAPPALRELIAFEASRAERLLDAGTPILTHLHGWARIAVTGYIAGGRATIRALRRASWDVLGTQVKPHPSGVALAAAALLIRPQRSHRRK
jgi:squalene synthase HpnC